MTFEVHSLMQDADHFDSTGYHANEQDVSGDGIFPISGANVIAGSSPIRIVGNHLHGAMEAQQIAIGLADTPAVSGVTPDFSEIFARAVRKNVGAHRCEARLLRISSRNSSISNGVEAPFCSPSIRAARNASSLVSCSSSSRSPAVTTSVAEPYRP